MKALFQYKDRHRKISITLIPFEKDRDNRGKRDQDSANFFYEKPDSKYSKLC